MSDDDEWDYQSNLATFTAVFQRKSAIPVVRLAWMKDSYLEQEYQGTLGSI